MSGGVIANWPIAHAPCQVTGTGPGTAEHVPAGRASTVGGLAVAHQPAGAGTGERHHG